MELVYMYSILGTVGVVFIIYNLIALKREKREAGLK